jgi:uncharacterized protein (TIGR03066 family)
MRALRMVGVGCLLLAVATAGLAGEKGKIDKSKLIGAWTFVKTSDKKEGPPPGASLTVEFTKDGKVNVTAKLEDKTHKVSGTYEVKGDTLTTVMKGPMGKEKKETGTIAELTDKKLVLKEEKDGKTVTTEFKK